MPNQYTRNFFAVLGLACTVSACADVGGSSVDGFSQQLGGFDGTGPDVDAGESDGDDSECYGVDDDGGDAIIGPRFSDVAAEYTRPEAVKYTVTVPDVCLRTVDLDLKLTDAAGQLVKQVGRSSYPYLTGYVRDLAPGAYTLRAWSTTETGGRHLTQQSFTIRELRTASGAKPKVDSITYTATSTGSSNRIVVTARASDSDGTIKTIEIFDNGVKAATGSTATFTKKLSPFKVQVRVTDSQGNQAMGEQTVTPPFDDNCSDGFCNG